jgi:hypothetical protein
MTSCTPLSTQNLPKPALHCPIPSRRDIGEGDIKNDVVFNSTVEYPTDVGSIQLLNSSVYMNKFANNYVKTSDGGYTPTFNDPRTVNFATGKRNQISNPPIFGEVLPEDMYKKRKVQYGGNIASYSDIGSGQIRYYVDNSTRDPFFKPNFTEKMNNVSTHYYDPMGAYKPQYERIPINVVNKVTHPSVSSEEFGLSFLRDTAAHRENIMATQLNSRNRQRWTPLH